MAPPAIQFHRFRDVPIEIRYHIWRLAIPDPTPEVLIFGAELNCTAFNPHLKTYAAALRPPLPARPEDIGPEHLGIPPGPPVVETTAPTGLLLACRESHDETRRNLALRTLHRAADGTAYTVPTRPFVPGLDVLYVHNLSYYRHGSEEEEEEEGGSAWLHRIFMGVWLPHVARRVPGGVEAMASAIAVPSGVLEWRGMTAPTTATTATGGGAAAQQSDEDAGLPPPGFQETLFSLPLRKITGVLEPRAREQWCPRDGRIPAQRRYKLSVVDSFTVPDGSDQRRPAEFEIVRFCLESGSMAAQVCARVAEQSENSRGGGRRRSLGPLRMEIAVLGLSDRPGHLGWGAS